MFDEMISRKLIEVIWVLASIGVVINGFVLMLAGGGGWSFLLALIFIAIGLLVVRVSCELMIVIFKIHENLEQSTFALGEIQRYQPQIVSKLVAQTGVPVASAPPAHVARRPAGSVSPQPAVVKESHRDHTTAVHEDVKDQVQSNQVVLKSKVREWPASNIGSTQ